MSNKTLVNGILEEKENIIAHSKEGVITLCGLCFWGIISIIILFIINPDPISVIVGILVLSLIIFAIIDIKTSNVWLTNRGIILKKFNKFYKIDYIEIRTFEYRYPYCRGRWDEALEIETIQGKKFEFQDINGKELFEKFCEINSNYIPQKLTL